MAQVFATYFDYFSGESEFGQWSLPANFLGLGNREMNPAHKLGPEDWRRDLWIGNPGDYPYIGPYNSLDPEVMRWHIRCAKAAGITGFLLYVLGWEDRKREDGNRWVRQLLDLAAQEQFLIGFVDHYTSLGTVETEGARSIDSPTELPPGRTRPILSSKTQAAVEIAKRLRTGTVSRSSPENVAASIAKGKIRIAEMLTEYKRHPAYLRIKGKPVMCIPFIDDRITPEYMNDLIRGVKAGVQPPEDLYIIGIVAQVYNFGADLKIDFPNTMLKALKDDRKAWADIEVNCFTSWTPNYLIDAKNKGEHYTKAIQDSAKFKKDTMLPMMPGFNDDNWQLRDHAPRARANGENWRQQIQAALRLNPQFLLIQAWNEWHEGSQIEPSLGYSDPFLYLKILAKELGKTWVQPADPPRESIDSWLRPIFPIGSAGGTTPVSGPTPVREFLVTQLGHQIGREERDGWAAATNQDQPGFLCFGPYTTEIPAGNHQAIFWVMIDNNTADNQVVVTLDVWDATTKKLLNKKEIKRKDFRAAFQPQDFEVPFSNVGGNQLEFRTFWHQKAWVHEHKVSVV